MTAPSPQARANAAHWARGAYVSQYDNRVLTPAEVLVLVRHRDRLGGRVLDVGCGAGRLLSYLVAVGADAHGLDIAPAMVEHCRSRWPTATLLLGDARDVTQHVRGPFDAVLAPDNLLDVFTDAERRTALAHIHEVLGPDGLLIFSTHDLGFVERHPDGPPAAPGSLLRRLYKSSPGDLMNDLRVRRRVARNRRRLAPLQERHADYAIINDFPHDFAFLHYHVRRDYQERQLSEVGFALVECLGSDGEVVAPGQAGHTDTVLYVARRT